MKKILSIILVLSMCICQCVPVANAIDDSNTNLPESIVVSGSLVMYGTLDSEKKVTVLFNAETGEVQFAAVHVNAPDYLYEYCFELDNQVDDFTADFFEELIVICNNNCADWTEHYLPNVVSIIEEPVNDVTTENVAPISMGVVTTSTASDTAYFESWIISQHGSEYHGRVLSTRTTNGITQHLKDGFQANAFKDYTYVIAETLSVTSFVTGVLGLAAGATAIGVIGLIAGTGGWLLSGTSVYEYTLRAQWYRFVTIDGGGYPYSLANKYIFYDAYVYTGTGGRSVDTASQSTEYTPSSTYYNSYTTQFDAAYQEYLDIGWQDGDF